MNFLLAITFFLLNCTSSSYVECQNIDYRLPQHINPLHYNIRLEPNFVTTTFNGSVIIEIQVSETSDNVTLHTNQLNISQNHVHLISSNGTKIEIVEILYDNPKNFYTVKTSELLEKGNFYSFVVESFIGVLNLDNGGFYLAKFKDENGNERLFATTQFESTNARKAFPCFDEPHMKATFRVQLIRKGNYISLTNENLVASRYLGNDTYEDTFNKTVKMSTYLVAFVVVEYNSTKRIKAQRVFADRLSVENDEAEFALQTGISVLGAGMKYLGTNYTLNKLDQIAIPDDYFAPGAMENWGLVTYRKSYLVYPFKNATSSDIQRTVNIISHEFAHHWFGNLVTASWWRFLWLNEGFANYFESFFASLVKPTWRLMDVFVLTSVQSALYSDSLNATKPMNSESEYPGGGPPSYIAYQKAGSVIRMMNHFLTENNFNDGLKLYLSKNLWGSVKPNNLYDELQLALDNSHNKSRNLLGGYNITEILSTWDTLEGYPLVSLKRNYTTGAIELSQKKFCLKNDCIDNNNVWITPINFLCNSLNSSCNLSFQTTADMWLTSQKLLTNYPLPVNDWVILNKFQTGYYRVNYDETNWKKITTHLISDDINKIPILNRAQLIDDSFNLARGGQLNYSVVFNLSTYMAREIDYIPFNTFLKSIKFIETMLMFTEEYDIFQLYINNLLQYAADTLGFVENQNDQHLDKLNRIQIIYNLCKATNRDCLQNSLHFLRLLQQNHTYLISPNLKHQIMCGALRIGQYDDWNFLFAIYQAIENPSHRSRILNALSCSENSTILNIFLNEASFGNTIRKGDISTVFSSIASNSKEGLITTFNFIKKNFEKLTKLSQLGNILSAIGNLLTTEEQLADLNQLKLQYPDQERIINGAITNTQENINWINTYGYTIKEWFNSYKQLNGVPTFKINYKK